jgi:hypothetical protein
MAITKTRLCTLVKDTNIQIKLTKEEREFATANINLFYKLWSKNISKLPKLRDYTLEDWLEVWYEGYINAVHAWHVTETLHKYAFGTILNNYCRAAEHLTLEYESSLNKTKAWYNAVSGDSIIVQNAPSITKAETETTIFEMIASDIDIMKEIDAENLWGCFERVCVSGNLTDWQCYVLIVYGMGYNTLDIQKLVGAKTMQTIHSTLQCARRNIQASVKDIESIAKYKPIQKGIAKINKEMLMKCIVEILEHYEDIKPSKRKKVICNLAKEFNCRYMVVLQMWQMLIRQVGAVIDDWSMHTPIILEPVHIKVLQFL